MWVHPYVLTRPARTSLHTFEPGCEFQRIDDWQGSPPNQMYCDKKGRILITDASAFKIKQLNFQIMSKAKKAATKKATDYDVDSIDLKLPTATIDLQAICANIWYKYFNDKTLSKSDKELLRNTYNDAARRINKINPGTIIIMNENPKWKPSTPEEGKYIPPSHEHLAREHAESVDAWLGRIVIDGADNMPPETFADEADVPLPKQKPRDLHVERLTTPRAAAAKSSAPKKEGGTVAQIIALFESGVSKADIINVHGFNKNTVNRQVGEYIKRNKK